MNFLKEVKEESEGALKQKGLCVYVGWMSYCKL